MGRTILNIRRRADEYKGHGLYINEENNLICKHCNCRVNWVKKDILEKHIKSVNHRKAISRRSVPNAIQPTISGMLNAQARRNNAKLEFIKETVKMCLKANIPLEKLDDPAVRQYFNKYIEGSGNLPCADYLRRAYVPICGEDSKKEIKEMLRDKSIAVIVDETSDKLGRCVFAVLFKTLLPSNEQNIILASCNFLNSANATTCCQTIVDTLKYYDILYNNIVGFVSDSAPYMISCFNSLKVLIGNKILHFKCWAHKISLVGNVYMKELKILNEVITKIKMAFVQSRKIKAEYVAYLKTNYPDLVANLFPCPVITRWKSWFNSVKYLDTYFVQFMEFFQTTQLKSTNIDKIIDLYKEEPTTIRAQCKYVAEICHKFIYLIDQLEGNNYPYAHLLWEEIEGMKRCLQNNIDGFFPAETKKLLDSMSAKKNRKIVLNFKDVATKSLLKLNSHSMSDDTNLFYETLSELFNPSVAGSKSTLNVGQTVVLFKNIPLLSELSEALCLEGYEHFFKQLVANIKNGVKPDIIVLLMATKIQHEQFGCAAIKSIWCPANSVDAERYFSKYNLVVTDRRTNLSQTAVETCSMLSFNKF